MKHFFLLCLWLSAAAIAGTVSSVPSCADEFAEPLDLIYGHRFCVVRDKCKEVEIAFARAYAEAPYAPFARAEILRSHLRETGLRVWKDIVPVNGEGQIVFRGNEMPSFLSLVAEVSPALNTTTYHSRYSPHDADVIVLGLHGNGGYYSHSGSMMPLANVFSSEKASQFKKELLAAEAGNGPIPKMYFQLLDQPGAGTGPDPAKFLRLGTYLEWLSVEIRRLKEFGKPIVVIARSGSAATIIEFILRYPGLIDKLVLSGPLHPHPEIGWNYDYVEFLREKEQDEESKQFNWVGWSLLKNWIRQFTWPYLSDHKALFHRTPTKIMWGSEDRETPTLSRETFRALVEGSPRSSVYEVLGGKHDVFEIVDLKKKSPGGTVILDKEGRQRSIRAYQEFLRFIRN